VKSHFSCVFIPKLFMIRALLGLREEGKRLKTLKGKNQKKINT